jgi:hypothetical protein
LLACLLTFYAIFANIRSWFFVIFFRKSIANKIYKQIIGVASLQIFVAFLQFQKKAFFSEG